MAKVLERSGPVARPAATGSKPPTRFVQNLLNKKIVTSQEADLLNKLPSPHLQFEALKRFREHPLQGLAAHVHAIKETQTKADESLAMSAPSTPVSIGAAADWIWQVLGKPKISPWVWKLGAGILAWIVLITISWNGILWISEHRKISPAVAGRAAPPPTVTVAVETPAPPAAATVPAERAHSVTAAPTVVHIPPLAAPQNLAMHATPNQMIQLTWDSLGDKATYNLYSSADAGMADAKLEDDAVIPVNWYNWMPPSEGSTVWLAVKGVAPDGHESPFSNSVKIDLPQPTANFPQQK